MNTGKLLGRCVFDDDICNQISEKFAGVNALIVGSPVYYGQPNGANIAGKPAALKTSPGT